MSDSLILPFDSVRKNRYLSLKSNRIIYDILNEIPLGLSMLEKVYFVYKRLAEIIVEDTYFAYNKYEDNKGLFHLVMDDSFVGSCRQICEILLTVLEDDKVGVSEGYFLKEDIGLRNLFHIDLLIKVGNKFYLLNLTRDLKIIKGGYIAQHFGINLHEEKEKLESIDGFELNLRYKYICSVLRKFDSIDFIPIYGSGFSIEEFDKKIFGFDCSYTDFRIKKFCDICVNQNDVFVNFSKMNSLEYKVILFLDVCFYLFPKIVYIDLTSYIRDVFEQNTFGYFTNDELKNINTYRILEDSDYRKFGTLIVICCHNSKLYYYKKFDSLRFEKMSAKAFKTYCEQGLNFFYSVERNGKRLNIC